MVDHKVSSLKEAMEEFHSKGTVKKEQFLTEKGKDALFKSIEEYVEIKIENRIMPANDKTIEKLEYAEEDLRAKLKAIKIILED